MKIKRIKKDTKSASVGIFVPAGSAFESEKERGLAHFIEHMLFKGTKKRTYKDIAADIDKLGGVINAFTSTEYTGFYVKVLKDYIPKAFDVLADIITDSVIDENELEKEKGVIIEEINMTNDNPDDAVYEAFLENAIPTSFGKPILGTKEHIIAYTREDLLKFLGKFYKPEEMIVSAVGGGVDEFDFDVGKEFFFNEYFQSKPKTELRFEFKSGIDVIERDIAQTNVVMGCELFSVYDDRKYAASLLNSSFGATMSSRLFQSIREEKSLCYSIYSSVKLYSKGGMFLIFAATSNDRVQHLIDGIRLEIEKLKKYGLTKEELENAKTNFNGGYALSLESSYSVMVKQAIDTILYGDYVSEDYIMDKINRVTLEDIQQVIDLIDLNKFHITCLGNIRSINW
ncbi:M16 family metallopeptidase [Hippea maritima]|uniref:Processing peptidase n=1 Tax=Hippea maritima (strain ATCC 700847 / DSM 10411 / MH2) TaxID=760142 RepID=F2LUM8_HIPMA|nr:pitrilysin family protein [Hippea maritima]AEA34618.1 processing peptidase [Hippea maritima DSM 10411]